MGGIVNSQPKTATIAINGTVSDTVDCNGAVPVSLRFPAAMTGTSVSFKSGLGATFLPLYNDDGTLMTVTVVVSAEVPLFPPSFMGIKELQIVSNATELAARAIVVKVRAID